MYSKLQRNKEMREYALNHPEVKIKDIAVMFNLSPQNTGNILQGEVYLKRKREEQTAFRNNGGRELLTQRRLNLKKEVLTYYGNGKTACIQCGESRLACLSIDHINGNGCQERRNKRHKWGWRFYADLKRQGYPSGFQTLCMNCQFCKAIFDRALNKERQ